MSRVSWDPQYWNGSVPRPPSVDFDGLGHYLHPEASLQLQAFAREFEEVWGTPFTISEASRSIATQEWYYDLWINGDGYPAAVPGTSSHGEDIAVDINSWIYGGGAGTERHNWMVSRMLDYGWNWWTVGQPSGESWHTNYIFGLRNIVATYPAADSIKPITPVGPTQEELDDMAANKTAAIVADYVRDSNGVFVALVYPDGSAVRLNGTMDVTALCVAHVQTYGLARTDSGKNSGVVEQYGSLLDENQWRWFWFGFGGKLTGFDEDLDLPKDEQGKPRRLFNNIPVKK